MNSAISKIVSTQLAAGFNFPNFRLLWAASFLGILSFFMVIIARGWLVLEMTNSPFLVAAVNAISMLPMMFFSAIGGALADRIDRRNIIILAEISNFTILLITALLLIFDSLSLWNIFFLSVLNGLAFTASMPARSSMVPNLVPQKDVINGVALFSTIFGIAQLFGPALSGYIIGCCGMELAFLLPTVFVVPAVILLTKLPSQYAKASADNLPSISIFGAIREGVKFTKTKPLLVGLLLLGMIGTIFAMPYQTLLPVFARDLLQAGPEGMGILAGAAGLGAILGSLAVARLNSIRLLKPWLIVGAVGLGFFVILFSASENFTLSIVLIFLLGFMMQVYLTSNTALVQIVSPDHVRGRVVGIRMFVMGLGPIGALIMGLGAELYGPGPTLIVMGAIDVVLTIGIFLSFVELRHLEQFAIIEN